MTANDAASRPAVERTVGVTTIHAPSAAPGLILAALVLSLYGGLAITVDFARAKYGIQSDEATYYMMAHSLAQDGDLTYRREDLMRVWRDFPTGPAGVFLKKGRKIVSGGLMLRPPFFWTTTADDPDPSRLYYGKSFIYPVFAAPFVKAAGTNGFLILHALLLAVVVWCSYTYLNATMRVPVAMLLAGGFVLVTVVPVYVVWMMPELFNFALGLLAYFCWLYKATAERRTAPRPTRWLFGPAGDWAAAILLGMATFSKVSNALLFPPIVVWLIWKRQWRRALTASALFGAVAAGLFAANMAISGEWNYQGGESRSTFYYEFPFQTPASGFDVGAEKERNEALTDIIFDRSVFWPNLGHNIGYYFVGRYAGLIAYFFPAVFALASFLVRPRRPGWQYLVVAAAFAQMLFFIVITPYTWLGGGGSVGNRYFMGAYGILLFVIPRISRLWLAVVPWVGGGLFMAPLVLNPFAVSFRPGSYAAHGPFRLLPVELTLVYDWPINTDPSRVRIWFGDNPGQNDPGFQLYFFDENAFQRDEEKSFWVKGASRAEFLVKTDRPMKRLVLSLTAGPIANDVTATVAGRTQRIHMPAGGSERLFFSLGDGFPYQGRWPVWVASVESRTGFVPIFHGPSDDTRYLGVRVKPMVVE